MSELHGTGQLGQEVAKDRCRVTLFGRDSSSLKGARKDRYNQAVEKDILEKRLS